MSRREIDVAAHTSPDCECVAAGVTIDKLPFTVVSAMFAVATLCVRRSAFGTGSTGKGYHHYGWGLQFALFSWGSTRSSSWGRFIMNDIKNTGLAIGNDDYHPF